MDLRLDQIRTDGGTQPRAQLNWFTIDEYAEAMERGDHFPPVTVFHDGTDYWLADGFHRYRAAEKLERGTITTEVRQGSLEDAQWYSFGANKSHGLHRTNDDKQKALKAALKHPNAVGKSDGQIADHCGVSRRMVNDYRREFEATWQIAKSDVRVGKDGRAINTANIGKPKPSIPDEVRETIRQTSFADNPAEVSNLAELPPAKQEAVASVVAEGKADTVSEALEELKRQKRQQREQERANRRQEMVVQGEDTDLPEGVDLRVGDFREVLVDLPANSVDLIFTDPPYDAESVPLYGDLAALGARVLRPGGSLITYAGNYAVPRIADLMGTHLRYWWTLALKHQGASARLQGKRVLVEWKPLLWYVKEDHGDGEYIVDFIQSHQPTKDEHDWQQDTLEARYLIEKLTREGGVVLDPMCGSGTTLIAALALGRRAIGVEKDAEHAARARSRIRNHTGLRAA